jgi:hypothetical protein
VGRVGGISVMFVFSLQLRLEWRRGWHAGELAGECSHTRKG